MAYTLMHKNIPVADIAIDDATGVILKVEEIRTPEHFPIGTMISYGQDRGKPRRDLLNDWWSERSIPASRIGIREALEVMGVCSTKLLLEKCNGLSLSDHYWIRPESSDLTWEQVNFFTNDFSSDVGEILFGRTIEDDANLMSPDNTADGWLKKRWFVANGKRFMMKGGSGVYQQEPFNEVVASVIMKRLGINHVDYSLTFDVGKPYSVCENFITPNTELVTAFRVKESRRKDNADSPFAHLLRVCNELGITGFESAMNQMLTLDYIINNEDRHYNNFGFIRNPDTLEWIGVAPVYDSGTSLWYSTNIVGEKTECKPFRSAHTKQVELVQDLSWLDFETIKDLKTEIISVFDKSKTIDSARANAIANAVEHRISRVAERSRQKSSLLTNLEIKQAKVKRTEMNNAQIPREKSKSAQEI